MKQGARELGCVPYQIDMSTGGHASVVRFDRRPPADQGAMLHLTLEDGRMLDCQLLDGSAYCAVVGEGPYFDRRVSPR